MRNLIDEKPRLWSKNFMLLASSDLINAFAFYFLIVAFPVYLKNVFSLSQGQIGNVVGVFAISSLLIRPIGGYVIDTIGRKIVYLSSFFLFSLIAAIYPLVSVGLLLFLVRIFHGFTWGLLNTSGITIVVDLVPQSRRGEGLGIYGMMFSIAMAFAPLLIFFIIKGDESYWSLFLSTSIFSFCAFVLSMFLKIPKLKNRTPLKLSLKTLFDIKSLPITLNILMIVIPYGGIITYTALFVNHAGIPGAYIGFFFLLLALSQAGTRWMSGRLFDKFGPFWQSIIGICLLIIGFPLFVLTADPSWGKFIFLLIAIVLGCGFGLNMSLFQAIVNYKIPVERRGIINSTYLASSDLGITIGIFLTGYLIEFIGYNATFCLFSAIELVAFTWFLTITYRIYQGRKMI